MEGLTGSFFAIMKMKSVWRIMEGLTGSFFCNEEDIYI